MSVLRAHGLVKRYGSLAALDGFDLTVEPGCIVGLIGPNGSGKTTALKSILGLCELDAGDLSVHGMNPFTERKAVMGRTAYIADVGILPRWMKVRQLVDFIEGVNPNFDRSAALAVLGETEIKPEKKIRTLSKGMRVQLHLALALASDATLLVLDEPTLGLDLLHRQKFYNSLLGDYLKEGRSVLVTTHEVREIEHILTDVVFIKRGRVVLETDMEMLARRFVKLRTTNSAYPAVDPFRPISRRHGVRGLEMIFADVDSAVLSDYGELSTPNLAELFVAVLDDNA